MIDVRVGVGAEIAARVSFTDDFDLVLSRDRSRQRPYRVSVKKSASRTAGTGAGLGIVAQWDDPQQVERIVGALLHQRLGFAASTLQRLVARAQGDLSASDGSLLEKVGEWLGVSTSQAKAALEELDQRLRETLHEIATAKIEIGFRYEYSRIETTSALLQVKLSERALSAQHRLLAGGQMSDVLARAEWDDETELELYLRERHVEQRRSFGFSLGIGPWLRLGDESQRRLLYVEQQVHVGAATATRISYLGQRSYTGTFGRSRAGWKVDLAADMPEPVQGAPRLSAFRFGLTLPWSWTNRKLNENLLAQASTPPCCGARAPRRKTRSPSSSRRSAGTGSTSPSSSWCLRR
ncbi:MAG TPA: hypothetical protein VMT85_07900 [Thermoanaerobaculia bacterium]|nr:hypothetical protein [Thermoanaerobaculia bacterium]